jgi:cobalamin biosynthesis protein CobT
MEIIRAHIKDGKVVNLSAGDTSKPWSAPAGVTVVNVTGQDVSIGDEFDGKAFTRPVVEVAAVAEAVEAVEVDRLTLLEQRLAALEKAVSG